MTVKTSRKAIRTELAALFRAGLADLLSEREDTHEPAVYRGQVIFPKMQSAVVVSSAGGLPYPLAVKTVIGRYDISVDIFVLYKDEENSWDEELAEDLLDDISDRVMDIITEHQRGNSWTALTWETASETLPINLNGVDYRREQIILKPS